MAELNQILSSSLRSYLTQPNLYNWTNENRILVSSTARRVGKFSVDFVKPAVDIYKEYDKYREQTLMVAAQLLKTEFLMNISMHSFDCKPTSILWLEPTIALIEEIFYQRIIPTMRSQDSLRNLTPIQSASGVETHSKRQSRDMIALSNGAYLFGNSPSQRGGVISKPIEIALCDEVDKWQRNALQDIRDRLTTYGQSSKLIKCSTPTDRITSIIYQEWLNGSRGTYCLKCKQCEDYFAGSSSTLQEADDGTPVIKCPECKYQHNESERPDMIDGGKYIHEDPDNKHRSYTCSHLAGPYFTLEQLLKEKKAAEAELERTADSDSVAKFLQSKFAEPYSPFNSTLQDISSVHIVSTKPGIIPDGTALITAAIDIQQDRIECEIVGWKYDDGHLCSYGIEYFAEYGGSHRMFDSIKKREFVAYSVDNSAFRKAFKRIHKPYYWQSDTECKLAFPVSKVCVDAGYETELARGACANANQALRRIRSKAWLPIFGRDGQNQSIIKEVEPTKRLQRKYGVASNIKNSIIYVDSAKSVIFNWLKYDQMTKDDNRYFTFNSSPDAGYCDENGQITAMYQEGLFSEEPIKNRYNKIVYVKKYPEIRNEPLDLKVYNLGAIYFYALDKGIHDPAQLLIDTTNKLRKKVAKLGVIKSFDV